MVHVRGVIVVLALAMVVGPRASSQGQTPNGLFSRIDHLVYATPDLQAGIDTIAQLLGVRASPGGQHPGLGTRNALVALGPALYLEIIGPDPDQPKPAGPRRFGIDDLAGPALVTWVAKGTHLDRLAADAKRHGIDLGEVIPGSRKRPDGVVLSWTYTDPSVVIADRLVPYFIDWGQSPHPAASAAPGATLVGVRAEHPDAERVQKVLDVLGVGALHVSRGSKPMLIATIDGPKGRVELRSR